MRTKTISLVLCLLMICPAAMAQDMIPKGFEDQLSKMQAAISKMQTTIENQNEVIKTHQIEIRELSDKVTKQSAQISADMPDVPDLAKEPGGLHLPGTKNWNPEVGVIGDVVAQLTEDTADEEGKDSIVVRELELVYGQYVDPYSRFDAAVVFNDGLEEQNAEIEQAYLTRYELPFNFKAQIGKIRPKIGIVNLLDRHQLETVTEPLVISNFFGEEGWKTSAVRLQNYIPNPFDIPLEITGEVLNGREAPSFADRARRPAFNVHLKASFDLSDRDTLDIGGTSLFGTDNLDGPIREKGNDRYSVHVFGMDGVYMHYFEGGSRLKLQSEAYIQDRNFRSPFLTDSDGDGVLETVETGLDNHPYGFYTLVDYKLNQTWSMGVRFDWLKPLDSFEFDDSGLVTGFTRFGDENTWEISPYITLYQSEFCLFRVQYSHTENAQGISDDAVFFQARFQIGVDRHGLQ